jgi:hypothetical protein
LFDKRVLWIFGLVANRNSETEKVCVKRSFKIVLHVERSSDGQTRRMKSAGHVVRKGMKTHGRWKNLKERDQIEDELVEGMINIGVDLKNIMD